MATAKRRKLGRTSAHRKALMRNLVTSLFENSKIVTTEAKAKDAKRVAEKMITIAKRGDLHSKRQVFSYLTKEAVAKELIDNISQKYEDRNGGYTRIIKIGPREGDGAMMVLLELV